MDENNGDTGQSALKRRLTKRWWIALSVVTGFVILDLISAHTIGFHLWGQDGGPKANEVAKDFKPRQGWVLTSEHFDDDPLYCLFSACSENIRTWNIGTEPITCDDLQSVLRDSGFTVFTHRDSYTPEANLELKTCKDTMLPGLTAEADARGGWMHVDASVSPPGYDPDSLPDKYRLWIRIAR